MTDTERLQEAITKARQTADLLRQDLLTINALVSKDSTPGGAAMHHLCLSMIEKTAQTGNLLAMLDLYPKT